MVKRRKFLVGMGSLAAGAAAATGTGAFTTATINDRTVTARVDADSNANIGLVAGGDPGITQSEEGKIQFDLTGGGDNSGVNLDSVYTWGRVRDNGTIPTDWNGDGLPTENAYAFKIVNNGRRTYKWVMEYHFDDTSWITSDRHKQSFIKFQAFKSDGTPADNFGTPAERAYPNQDPAADEDKGFGQRSYHTDLKPGEAVYIVVSIDTTNELASTDDKLAGTATFHFDVGGIHNPSWNDGW